MKKISVLFLFLSLLFLTFITINCRKQDEPTSPPPPPKLGAIKGKVSSEYNQLLEGALLTIRGNEVSTSVEAIGGNYIFDSLEPGSYDLSVKKDGYIETSATISIASEDTTNKDFILKAGTAYFNLLSDSIITASPYTGTFTIKVASNTAWLVSNGNDWITPAKTNSNGDDSVVVHVAASPVDTVRQSYLTLQAGSIVKKIMIKQLADVKLKQVTALPGNMANKVVDSIALLFNQPITIKSIFPGTSYCQSDIRVSYLDNKVTFSYACGAIGGDYPFTITTVNSLGDQFTFTFTVGFYEKAINLTGTIKNYFVNDADNSYWVITDHPNALYKIDMNSFEILHKYDLPNEPAMFTISPYDNKIYLAYRGIPKLYIMDQSGTTEKEIDIPNNIPRGQNGFNGSMRYPINLVFTKNGIGLIWLSDEAHYTTSFWFIDAKADHRIWYEDFPGEEVYYLTGKANYDKSKLILTYSNDIPTIGIFDSEQMKFSSYRPSKTTRGVFNSPSRKNADVYSGQLDNQLIVNPETGYESLESLKDNGNFGNMDFCYKPGKEQTIYFTEQGYIEVINYTNGSSPVIYDAIPYLQGTTATLDGKYLIVNRHDGNYNAKVIQLSTSWFDY